MEHHAPPNISAALRLSGSLDRVALEQALAEIMKRAAVACQMESGTPTQEEFSLMPFSLPVMDLQTWSEEEQLAEIQRLATQEAQQRFDLIKNSWLRFTLLRLGEEEHLLLLTRPHLIFSEWLMEIFSQELGTLYRAFLSDEPSSLSEHAIEIADFAHQPLTSHGEMETLFYWKHQLIGAPPLLALPTDRPRPKEMTLQGNSHSITLHPDLTQQLEALSEQSGVTLFMTLLAAFATLLSHVSGQEDIIIGSPIAVQRPRETASQVGFFVKTLPLRIDLSGSPTFQELLAKVRQVVHYGYSYQDVSFEQVMSALELEQNPSHSPLFQVKLVLQNALPKPQNQLALTITPLELKPITPFDLTLSIEQPAIDTLSESGMRGVLEYNADLFDADTIAWMASCFETLLEEIVADPQQQVSALPLRYLHKRDDYVLPDSKSNFFAQVDHQVEIRGYRIKLEEVEAVLLKHPDVQEVVVLAREDESGNKYLIAYVVARDEQSLSASDLRSFLEKKQPDYMVPSTFVLLDALPLTSNGKVDRDVLPASARTRPQLNHSYVAPRNALEYLLANIWKENLAIANIGVYDNLLDLGDDSAQATIVIKKIQEQLGEKLDVLAQVNSLTIVELAAYLNNHYPEALARWLVALKHGRSVINATKAAEFRQLMATSSPEQSTYSTKNQSAVFILCPPRSGSTLLRVILAGHPQLFAPPELALLLFKTLKERKEAFSEQESFFFEGLTRSIMQIKGYSVEEAQRLMQELEEQNLSTKQFYYLMQQWIGDKTLVEKEPLSALELETLKRTEIYFEKPLYIHLVRHPYGMIHSFEKARLDLFSRWRALPFSRREIAELVWLTSHQNILSFLSHVPDHRIHRVKFEDLVHIPRESVEGICQFLNRPFKESMLEPYQEKSQRMTDGIYTTTSMAGDATFHKHKRINPAVANKWKKDYAFDFLSDLTWQVARSLGYKPLSSEHLDPAKTSSTP